MQYRPKQIGDAEVRYALIQKGNRMLFVVGLNPSTADTEKPDPTMQSVMRIAEYNGYDGFVMINLYPKRATAPKDLPQACDPVLHRNNLEYIKKVLVELVPFDVRKGTSQEGDVDVWLAYGNNIDRRDYLLECLRDIIKVFEPHHPRWYHINSLTGKGHPRHPLYQKVGYLKNYQITESL